MERPDSRLIRVFLSSTFVDFQEERSLLVQQVFPSLRRRARSREVEIVDVDLRWGVTAEQTERGETLPLCLGEIDRCRPYFISLLGERYGWVPPPAYYKPELLERQPWLKQRMGGASVTELEILHGVLRNPEMAGHAFFYLRDPAYAQAQSEPGWVAENPAEWQRLEALKAQIRTSGFPVAEGLPSPQAIAERIEADLWELIESRFPEQEPADALDREGRRHSDYRRARTGLYLGGGPAIEQLERWISDGEQRILITGESGVGKSALIANWLEAHQRSHPQDLVHAHHLGCTNDASAVRPLLGRLIDTASQLLLAEQQISEAIQVPQDWWELVFKVGEVFALLSSWCQRQGRRWILVLDGLDRLAEEDQQALPWVPTTIPPSIHVVASALDCQARTILQERQYRTHEIGPLGKAEQQQLIERYLSRYTKQLESGLQQQILAHPLAGSPLFLRVLLEELRQCAWFDTLQGQVEFYLSAETIDGLYAKVLERLENDGYGEAVRKVITTLWAGRAGLSEDELLGITGLAPLQWAPIDLALEQAFGRNGNRLVFDHDYLRQAVQDRYLPTEEHRWQAHSELADWYLARDDWDVRHSEELPWQLRKAGRLQELCNLLLDVSKLDQLSGDRSSREVLNYWLAVKDEADAELDELISEAVEKEIEERKQDAVEQYFFVNRIAALLREAGLYRELLLRLRTLSLELEETIAARYENILPKNLDGLACAHQDMGHYDEAESLYRRYLEAQERQLGPEHPDTLTAVCNLAGLYMDRGDYEQAEASYIRCLEAQDRLLGPKHPDTLRSVNNLGQLYIDKGDYEQAEAYLNRCLEASEWLLGPENPSTLTTVGNLGNLYRAKGDYEQAEAFYTRCLEAQERLLGPEHPDTLTAVGNLAGLYQEKGYYEQAEDFYKQDLEGSERLVGPEHPHTLIAVGNLAGLYQEKGDYEQAEAFYIRCLEAQERLLGPEHPDTLTTVGNLAVLYSYMGNYEQAEAFYVRCLEARERRLGPEHPDTNGTRLSLANLLSEQERYAESIPLRRKELEVAAQREGRGAPGTLTSIDFLAEDLLRADKPEEAEQLYREALAGRITALGDDDGATMASRYSLALCLSAQERYSEAICLRRLELAWCRKEHGDDDPGTLASINGLAIDLCEVGELQEAEALSHELLEARQRLLDPSDVGISQALSGLANTLEAAGKLEEALAYAQQALAHRLEHEGPDAWWINRERIDLARVLNKLGRDAEARSLVEEAKVSLGALENPDDNDRELLAEALALLSSCSN